MGYKFKQVGECLFEIPKEGKMRVPGRIFAAPEMIESIRNDRSPEQVANVAHLPGIVGYSFAMPDIHWGYGFPIGGVAAFDPDEGVISPGGVGYDINCGVRLCSTKLTVEELDAAGSRENLAKKLYKWVPTGVGSKGAIAKLSQKDMREVAKEGAKWAISKGYGSKSDLEYIEEKGRLGEADPDLVTDTAVKRGSKQLGTLGSGNHFLEVDVVDEVYDEEGARMMGLEKGKVAVIIHCGSRGYGYQICEDNLALMQQAVRKYGLDLPDKQLACAPLTSSEARHYLGAMRCAANYAWANRQVIMSLTEKAFTHGLNLKAKDLGLNLIYDVCHNIAKFEEHEVDGEMRQVCVHRKGATRSYPPHHKLTPDKFKALGQPVLIPGDMGRYSFVCVGRPEAMKLSFGSSCHGAGRVMSRNQSKKQSKKMDIYQTMKDYGVIVKARGHRTIAEEMPHAYKDVADVIDVVDRAGLSKKIARLKPIIVIKG